MIQLGRISQPIKFLYEAKPIQDLDHFFQKILATIYKIWATFCFGFVPLVTRFGPLLSRFWPTLLELCHTFQDLGYFFLDLCHSLQDLGHFFQDLQDLGYFKLPFESLNKPPPPVMSPENYELQEVHNKWLLS